MNSVISGSLLVPYCTSYQMTQTWTIGNPVVTSSGCTSTPTCNPTISSLSPVPTYPSGVAWPSTWATWSNSLTTQYSYCTTAPVPLKSNHINSTIEGGGTYLQSTPSLAYYYENLSDAGSMGLPYINYNIFTNRIFGESYVNVTVNPTDYGYYQAPSIVPLPGCTFDKTAPVGDWWWCAVNTPPASCVYAFGIWHCLQSISPTYSSPWVINAVHNYNYQLVTVNQNWGGTSYPGYTYQLATPDLSGTITFSTSDLAATIIPSTCTLPSACPTQISYPDNPTTAPTVSASYSGTLSSPTISVSCTPYVVGSSITCTAVLTPSAPGVVGINNCGASCSSYYYNSGKAFAGYSALAFSGSTLTKFVTLQSLYAQTSQLDSIILDQTGNPAILGYNRLIYTFVDAFNNKIYAPLDTDFAHPVQVLLAPTVTINAINSNETTVDVSGTATYTTLTGSSAALTDSYIYLYYNTNFNYYDTANAPSTSSTNANVNYFTDSLLCAFAAGTQNCQLTNPLFTTLQPTIGGIEEANVVSFSPEYNALPTTPTVTNPRQCQPEPTSLLAAGNFQENCNVYGLYGLKAVTYDSTLGSYKYCVPDSLNGNGVFTSQLGLVYIAHTDSNGFFDYQFNVCGNGNNQVIAAYYGSPTPQPTSIAQTSITASAGASEFFTSAPGLPSMPATNEFTYTFAPDSTTSAVTIGSFALSFGRLDVVEILAVLVAAVMLVARRVRS